MGKGSRFSLEAARDALIDAAYAASTDASRWHEFTSRATDWLGGGSSMFSIPKAPTRMTRLISGTLDPEMVAAHDRYYHAISPWVFRIGATDPLDLVEAMVPMEQLERSEYYCDWMAPQDYHFMMGIRPKLADGDVIGFAVGRAKRHGSFDAEERQLLIDLAPHLARAADISRRFVALERQSRASSGLLEVLGAGLILVDHSMRVEFSNQLAEGILAAGDGLAVSSGRLRCENLRKDAELRAAVQSATSFRGGNRSGGTTLSLDRERNDLPLSVTVSPFDERDSQALGRGPFACVVVSLPEVGVGIDIGRLRSAYGLTQAEARLVIALCSGRSLAEYGEEIGISINTAKYHLKGVFDKTGETRQADLVRRMLRNPAIRITETAE